MKLIASVSPKPVRYVFDTHAHGDHSYANAAWTRRGAPTMAFAGVAEEMKLYEPERWQTNGMKRDDVRATGETNVEIPKSCCTAIVLSFGTARAKLTSCTSAGATHVATDSCGSPKNECCAPEMPR